MKHETKAKKIAEFLYDAKKNKQEHLACYEAAMRMAIWKDMLFKKRLDDFVEKCKPLDADIQKIVNENFWDLV